MPTYYCDPNGATHTSAKSQWDAGNSWDKVDDGTRQPTVPTVGSDNVTSSTSGDIDRIDYTSFTLPPTEYITQIKFWSYYEANGAGGVQHDWFLGEYRGAGNGDRGILTSALITGTGWQSVTWVPPWTGINAAMGYSAGVLYQEDIDSFVTTRIRNSSGSASTVASEYVEFTTAFQSGIALRSVVSSGVRLA